MPSKSSRKAAKKVGKRAVSKSNKKASKKSTRLICDTEYSERSRCPTSFGWGQNEHRSSSTSDESDCEDRCSDDMEHFEDTCPITGLCLCPACCSCRGLLQDDFRSSEICEESDWEDDAEILEEILEHSEGCLC